MGAYALKPTTIFATKKKLRRTPATKEHRKIAEFIDSHCFSFQIDTDGNLNVQYSEIQKNKGVDTMALAQRISPGYIISQGKEEAFFKTINENRLTEEFWDECKYLRENISKEAIDEMDALMDREE